jgi:hypothetical protein
MESRQQMGSSDVTRKWFSTSGSRNRKRSVTDENWTCLAEHQEHLLKKS